MAAGEESPPKGGSVGGDVERCLQKFRLYETRSKFYMIGRNKSRTSWRVLTIDRLEPSELNVHEDAVTYSTSECYELLKRIHEGNKSTGGLKFVTNCYGIVGFVKFLGPYYMLLITKRRPIGVICGHTIYRITRSRMIAIPNSMAQPDISNTKDENRCSPMVVGRQLFMEGDHACFNEHRACESNCSNFLDLDLLSSASSSEEIYERSSVAGSSIQGLSTENIINGLSGDAGDSSASRSSIRDQNVGISEHFVDWVVNGGTFYH